MSQPAEMPNFQEPVDQTELAAIDAAPKPADPLLRGHFSLYVTPDGGLLLSVRLDGEDADQHLPIPKHMLRMMRMFGGDPVQLLSQLGAKG